MTIEELLKQARRRIAGDSPRLDAELLLAMCLGRNRSYLYARPEQPVDADVAARFEALVTRRAAGEPIAYLTGARAFWSLELEVSPCTLIPRPETERLVEIALQLAPKRPQTTALDLGTGTGAIALALARERADWTVLGVDIEPDAVQLAQRNAARHGIANVSFRASDWFADIQERFDLIVANPPYIDADDPHLQQGDVRFEPRRALVAGGAGLDAIATIASQAPEHLQSGGWLLVEHGLAQGAAVRGVLGREGFTEITTWCDAGGRDRVTGGRRAA